LPIPNCLHHLNAPEAEAPPTRVLSNGRYTVLRTASGTGYCSWNEHLLSPWSGDRVEDQDGFVTYLRDLESGRFWSVGARPLPPAGPYRASWRPGWFRLSRAEEGIEAVEETCVPPVLDVELRRLRLRNVSGRRRRIEVTTLTEVALHVPAAHAAHPAFSKLFLQTEFLPGPGALLARRRPRAAGEVHPWMLHAFPGSGALEHETDRARFLGRGGGRACPRALSGTAPLSGTVGNVLDPVLCLRRVLELEPGEEGDAAFLIGAAPDREAAVALLDSLQDPETWDRRFRAAEAAAGEEMARLGLSGEETGFVQALAGAVLYRHPGLRAGSPARPEARGSVLDLARAGISPQRALVVLRAGGNGDGARGFGLLTAHRAWSAWNLPIDLVRLSSVDLPRDLVEVLLASARLVVDGPLPEPAPENTSEAAGPAPGDAAPGLLPRETAADDGGAGEEPLQYENGWGGFAADSGDYVIRVEPRRSPPVLPPRPWINVVANERFGFFLSETGAGCTWSGNSREHRLTPWANDPLLDPHGEALYLRDEETGHFWSPLPGPRPGPGSYEMRHGLGFSRCRYRLDGLEQETTLFVPRRDPVRVIRIRLANRSGRPRRLSLTSYSRLDLTHPVGTGPPPVTGFDPLTRAVLARNPLSGRYAERVVFARPVLGVPDAPRSWTGDRRAFLGPGGDPARPAALLGPARLDGRTGPGLDPCIACRVELELAAGETIEVGFLLGEGESEAEARDLLARYAEPKVLEAALEEVTSFWQEGVSRVQVETPSPGLDLLLNRWLPYQVVSCRIWGRSALYQSGGAFGFRDQLQDAGAMVLHWPELTRSQILLHAGHQFAEGDVLHWWHPPGGEGIRTRFGDDLLWLPFLTAHYVRTTGDREILDEAIPFLTARLLVPGEDEAFLLPGEAKEAGNLYEHGCRALDRSLDTGAHGLPLFGSGDWNDGMNRVGVGGRGESVWLGQFLFRVLGDYLPLCEARGDEPRVRRYRAHREALRTALNDAGWDGEWYRRGFYDNGDPLGSKASDECRIDALAQAWAVLSGTAPPERAARAMEAVDRSLVSEEEGILRLLTPPFENTPNDPGYIKGYVPGVRENGGQYTHAALWVVCAFAELGRNDRVARLLEMLSPVSGASAPDRVARYGLEPYVVAADVYGVAPHVGRGGWSWYTGSAGWMLRAVLEYLLGMRVLEGKTLVFRPCIPDAWPGFRIRYRTPGRNTRYEIQARNPDHAAREVTAAVLDGTSAPVENGEARIPLVQDGELHRIEIVLGRGGGRDR